MDVYTWNGKYPLDGNGIFLMHHFTSGQNGRSLDLTASDSKLIAIANDGDNLKKDGIK